MSPRCADGPPLLATASAAPAARRFRHFRAASAYLLCLAVCVFAAGAGRLPAGPASASPEPSEDEKILRDAGVSTEGTGLVAFFRSHTPTPADQERLTTRIGELGSNSFAERDRASHELTAAGRFSLPLLRPALSSPDLEVARRAARCIEEIEQLPTAMIMASAARVTAAARPEGAAEALLGVLPWVDEESAEDAVIQALVVVGLKDKVADPAVVSAAADKNPLRRAAAGYVLGQAGPTQQILAVRLLTDADARVRFRSAGGLLRGGERAAVPALIALLDEGPAPLASQAEEILTRLPAERDLPGPSGGDDAGRRRARSAWESWWKQNETRVDLSRAARDDAYLGLTLIVELDNTGRGGKGRVWECGPDGKPRWEMKDLPRPIDARLLPNGRVLVAEHGPPRVTERQRDGTVVWEYSPPGQPVSCQRLANGNTFVATYNELVEVTREKVVVFSAKLSAQMVFYGQKLRNGHYLYISSGNRIVELDARGKEVLSVSVENSGSWASVESLPNGNFLVALYNAGKVVELDRTGKVTWQCKLEAPGHATRLRNGNTLVVSIEGRRVAEYDRSGKEVWRQATAGRPFHAYRR